MYRLAVIFGPNKPVYFYLSDLSVGIGDHVVVDTGGGYKVVKVDACEKIPLGYPTSALKHIVCIVDDTEHKKRVRRDNFDKEMRALERCESELEQRLEATRQRIRNLMVEG